MSNAWITLLAYEARSSHAADRCREEATARRLASVRSRVVADLRRAIASDIEGFLREDGNLPGSALTCRNGGSPEGFIVSRSDDRLGTRRLAVDLRTGTLSCQYELCEGGIGTASDQRNLAVDISDDGVALSLWDRGLVRRFATVDSLSAFLLAPILGVS